MKRSIRNDVASATVALCLTSFGTFLWLFFAYFSSHPTKPNAELGFVRALNNHGSYVYLSDTESTGLALLILGFFVGLLATGVIAPKDPFGAVKADFATAIPRMKIIFLCSLVFYLAVIWLVGPALVRLVVSQGIVLHI